MRISRKLAALAAFFVIALAVAACGGSSIPGNSVADVAGNPITLKAFNHWMYVDAKDEAVSAAEQGETEPVIVANDPPKFTGCIKQIRSQIPTLASTKPSTLRTDCKQVFQQYTSQVMAFLIEGYWYQADAYKVGIRYSKAQLDKDFAKAKKAEFPTENDYKTYLSETGETQQDVLFQIRLNTLYQKLLKRYEKPVTNAAISAYFTAHRSQFGTPETRDAHLVRTNTEAKAQAALSALRSGQSWDTVAKQYSETASGKTKGGLLTGITPNEEEQAVNKALFGSPVNKLLGPIKGIFGWYVLEVTKITPATHESLAKATSTIKSTLTNDAETNANKKVTSLSKKSWFKHTTCRTLYQVSDCSNYVKPKTTTTTPTPATTTPTPTTTTPTSSATATTGSTGTTSTSTAASSTDTTTTGS